MASLEIDDQCQSSKTSTESTTFKVKKFQTYSSTSKKHHLIRNRRGWISHKWSDTQNDSSNASCKKRCSTVYDDEVETVAIECDSDHSNLDLTSDDEDDDDDSMNGTPNEKIETKDDSEDDQGCDDDV